MSTNLQQIGTPFLDMDNIAAQLHIKGVFNGIDTETGEEQYSPFVTLEDLASAGSEDSLIKYLTVDKEGNSVPVSRIALAYLPDDAVTASDIDRDTVKNSKYLDNKAPEYFATKEYADKINSSAAKMADYFNNEISDIKANCVMLMSSIAKNGLTENYRPFAGFYDTFREAYPVHQKGYLASAFVDSLSQDMIRIKEEELKYFSVGDYVVVVNGDDVHDRLNRAILKIDQIKGTTLIFNGYTGFPIKYNTTKLYRSLGTAHKNSFVFGYFEEKSPDDTKIYTGVDDDNYRTRRKIVADHTGYATTFRINPNRAKGSSSYYLSSIEICARKIGAPGALKCYVINATHIADFEDPEQARDEGYILAESQPLTFDSKLGETIVEFDFRQNGQYPLLEDIDQGIDSDTGRTRFCMIIEALSADNKNYYELLFLQHYDATTNSLSDLQMNNIVYEYTEQPSTELMSSDIFKTLTTSNTINKADLFYGITLHSVDEGYFVPDTSGVYSAEFKTYEPVRVNNARLTMRVAREGYFTVAGTSGNTNNDVTDGGIVRYVEDKSYRVPAEQSMYYDGFAILSDQGEEGNRKVIIGTHIAELDSIDGDKLTIKNGANIQIGDPVYPMSYTASLLCSNKVWDDTLQSYVTKGDPVRVPLKISSVQPAYFEQEKTKMLKNISELDSTSLARTRLTEKVMISDNLVFDADFSSTREFNHFQLQIYWRSMAGKACQSFAGRIYDLALNLNRKILW